MGAHSAERLPTALMTSSGSCFDFAWCLESINTMDSEPPKLSFRTSMAILCQDDLKPLLL